MNSDSLSFTFKDQCQAKYYTQLIWTSNEVMVLALRFKKKKKSPKFNNALQCQSRLVSVIQSINITRCLGMEESKTFVAIPKIQSSTHRCVMSVRNLSTKSKPHAPIGYSSRTIHRGIPGRFCSCCEVRLDFCQHLMRTELL